jgi:hypothetical protein
MKTTVRKGLAIHVPSDVNSRTILTPHGVNAYTLTVAVWLECSFDAAIMLREVIRLKFGTVMVFRVPS